MGRGTKHKTDWKPTTLQTAIDARRLYTHTVKIIGNPKVFKPENDFHNVTLFEIHKTVLKIYMCIWKANRINAVLHPERASDGILFLGFVFRVTDTGRVRMSRDPDKVKALRRKFLRLANKVKRGEAKAEVIDESWQCARACMEEGNSERSLRNMDDSINNLKEEINARDKTI